MDTPVFRQYGYQTYLMETLAIQLLSTSPPVVRLRSTAAFQLGVMRKVPPTPYSNQVSPIIIVGDFLSTVRYDLNFVAEMHMKKNDMSYLQSVFCAHVR